MKNISLIAKKLGLKSDDIEKYGDFKAKIKRVNLCEKGKLILVTSINPTKSGEGKTTVAIGLADAFSLLKKSVCLALREPSLGPVFGMKGGATGGGKSVVVPSEDINLHFTGDMHAITSANNLLCAMIDNHIFQGNDLKIKTVVFHRCLDINDRALREITINQEKLKNNFPRKESFVITPASEIMAIVCLAKNYDDLLERLGKIIVGFNNNDLPIYARDLKAENALAIILKDAFKPNLVQTELGTPAIIHGGPFANIAHGCNSLIATKTALSLADYVVTEAGFGADLGAEKFFDIKCRMGELNPSGVVVVVTVKALKEHGSIEKGFENLDKHINNIQNVFNKNCVVAINKFESDKENDLEQIRKHCEDLKVPCEICSPFIEGGKGCEKLCKMVLSNLNEKKLHFAYSEKDSLKEKICCVAKKVYGASGVEFSSVAKEKMKKYEKIVKNFPICIAKTQYSLSDDEKLLGSPTNFILHVKDIEIKNGAGFVVVICGEIMLMPGLPKVPNAVNMHFNA